MSAFGDLLRASRLGYRWVPRLKAWVQVSGDGPLFRVCLARDAHDMGQQERAKGAHMHFVWWDHDKDGELMWSLSPALRSASAPCEMLLNEEGIEAQPSRMAQSSRAPSGERGGGK